MAAGFSPAQHINPLYLLGRSIIIPILHRYAKSNPSLLPKCQQTFQKLLVHSMLIQCLPFRNYTGAVHMDYRIRLELIPVPNTQGQIHISSAGNHDHIIFSQNFQRLKSAFCNFPCLMIQKGHIQIKTDDPFSYSVHFLCPFLS